MPEIQQLFIDIEDFIEESGEFNSTFEQDFAPDMIRKWKAKEKATDWISDRQYDCIEKIWLKYCEKGGK